MTKLIGNAKPDSEALQQMHERGGDWAAYQNHAMDSAGLGELRFLQYGEGRTFATPPDRYPDTQHGTGWRHLLVGHVNLESGEIFDFDLCSICRRPVFEGKWHEHAAE